MSKNLDLVRSIYADWARGDFGSADWADREIEFVIGDGPDPRTFRGLAEMAAGWREFLTAWTDYGVEADEYRELGDGRVLVVLHAVGRGKTSGVELGQTSERGANLYEITGNKVTRLVIYFDRERALADLGLEE
jgi:ketosteroid isomerase-like protein